MYDRDPATLNDNASASGSEDEQRMNDEVERVREVV